jgi:hypothetical protein
MYQPVRQSVCGVCGEVAGPGRGIVLEYGAGGRVHIECLPLAEHPVPTKNSDWHEGLPAAVEASAGLEAIQN